MSVFAGAFGVPHTPIFAQLVNREGSTSETGRLFATVREALGRAKPDVIVIFDTDHLNTFFLDNLPVFAVGVGDRFNGPNDEPPDVPRGPVPSHRGFAEHLRAAGIADGFDLAMAQEFEVDHSIMVPVHFLTPDRDVPVVPVFVSGHVPPLPSAARCLALGRSVRRAIESFSGADRVAVVGTGSFSLEVYGPRVAPGLNFGVPDPGWAARVHKHLKAGCIGELVQEATSDQMHRAGNVAGELLDWIAMLGTLDARPADWIEAQPRFGHSYAYWQEPER